MRFVHVYLPGVSRKPQRQRKEGLAADLNPVGQSIIYRSITIYLFEYNVSNIGLAPGGNASGGSRIRYPREASRWRIAKDGANDVR
jgi:hypothetical protein